MITLAQMRERVTARLAEESTVFWTVNDRNRAINDAQKFVATVSKGVEVDVTPQPGKAHASLKALGSAGIRMSYGFYDGYYLPAVSSEEATLVSRRWRQPSDFPPIWVVVDARGETVYLAPPPKAPKDWRFFARVVPGDISDGEKLFLGRDSMEKFLNATSLIACAYLLLQERFDGDAERFYQMGLQELTALGVDSGSIPALQGGIGPSQEAQ